MRDIPTKAPDDKYFSAEFNSPNDEQKNMVTQSGQTLNDLDNNQFSKAVTNYVASSDFYTDSSVAADVYTLVAVETNQSPTLLLDGLRLRFVPANTNTGPSTVSIPGLGAVPIKKYGVFADLVAEDLVAGLNVELAYRKGSNIFELVSVGNPQVKESLPLFMSFSGMNLANNSGSPNNKIDLARGTFKDRDTPSAFTSTSTIDKDLASVWAEGTGLGGRASGVALSIDTWYHVFVLGKTDGTVDMGFDTDINAVNLLADTTASGYIFFRRRGSILTELAGTNILGFKNLGNLFVWDSPVNDPFPEPPISPSVTTKTLRVPNGVFSRASIGAEISGIIATGQVGIALKSTFQSSFPTDVCQGFNIGASAMDGKGFQLITMDTLARLDIARSVGSVSASGYAVLVSEYEEIDL